jgi:hypothetical protein
LDESARGGYYVAVLWGGDRGDRWREIRSARGIAIAVVA